MGFEEYYKITPFASRRLTKRDERKCDLTLRTVPIPVSEKMAFLKKGPFFWFAAGGGFLFFN